MSDQTIRKGDLVMVVRGCGCHDGEIHSVNFIFHRAHHTQYVHKACGYRAPAEEMYADTEHCIWPVSWLRKIPPQSLETETEREMEAI